MREMKDSGVAWIGEIPANWKIVPLKSLFSFGKGLPITKDNLEDTGIPVISYGQIHAKWNSGVTTHGELLRYVNESYLGTNPQSLVRRGDLIMADTSEDREGCGNCAYVDTDETLFAGYHTIILRSINETDNKYLAYLFLTDSWRSQIRQAVSGVKLFSVSRRILGSVSVIVPDNADEIVAYLDDKCAQVNTLISNVQAQIEKLKAHKQSLITEVVTKGLDPNVPMKDSGVDYLGRIPSGWSIISIGQAFTYVGGFAFKSELFTTDETQYQVLRIGNVKNDNLILDNKQIYVDGACAESAKVAEVHIDDILFTMTGTKGKHDYFYTLLVNENHTSDRHLFINQRVGLFRAKSSKIKMAFANYVLKEKRILDYIFLNETGTANQGNIGIENIARTKLYLPSLAEQEQIVSYLDEKCSQIDRLIALKEEKIEKLEQYKKSLIYEYVTGKREVV